MSKTPRPLGGAFAAVALLPLTLSAVVQIHVSPAGDDANPGTASAPVATPQGAQAQVRTAIQAGLTDSVDVIFAAGTYHLAAPLELRPEDSGTAQHPIAWKAAEGATAILDGGRRIAGPWIDGGGGIWHTDLTGTGLGAGQWNFRQLFVNGSRATRARFPNKSAPNPYLYATGGAFDHVIVDPALVKPAWGTAADAQINIVPQSRFFNQWNTVTAVTTASGRIDIADSERHRTINSGSWFWIEGVQAELDEPGEWFLDPASGRLSYMPQPGVDPNTLTIVAPFLNRIVNAKGDVDAGTHVAHVHFDGLGFRHTDFTLGHIEARVHTDTAIMFENTSDSSVKNCDFENIGGYALWLHLDSKRNVFDHNTVSHSGGGVLLTGSRFAYMDDTKVYTPGEAAAKVFPILNEITRNTVEHCGRIRYYGGGVHLDSRPFSMTMAPGNRIAHNHFNDLSRNGVFAFRNQGGNVVEYNHIHNCMQTTIDGAAVHFATMNTVNAPNFILNNWLHDIWGWSQQTSGTPTRSLGNGVFLDWDTSNTTVKDNWIYNSVGGAVKVIFGGNRNVVNTANQSSSTVITPPFVAEVGPDGTATNGIDLANNKLTGSIISYQDAGHFSKTGTWTEETATGLVNLFEFQFLAATAAVPSRATYTLPIPEDGTYEISLIYYPGSNRASNVPIAIDHADGISNITWNMRQGSTYGFAVPVGSYRFVAAETNTLTLSTAGTDGKVIADSVGFVKVEANQPPVAANPQVAGSAAIGGTLTGSYTYGDADGDPEGASILRWYRSTDAVLDAGDTVVAGVIDVSPVAVKTSTAYTAQRLAGNLFNANGMGAKGTELLNLNGSQAGEPTTADGVSWVTHSGSEATLLADRKAWFVADLGASFALTRLRVWNFQWAHSSGDLSNRGISRFDCYLRNSAADTSDGTPGGTAINPDASAATFALGSANPWQAALVDQALGQAPNADTYTGQSFSLAGQTGRFLAIVADGYYGGAGIALGKVRVQAGQPTLNYTAVAADAGNYLIFEVTPVAASGVPIGAAAWAASWPVATAANTPPAASNVNITGIPVAGGTLQGGYAYSDAESDAESGTTFRWLRSDDGVLDAGDIEVGTAASYVVQAADAGKTLFFEVTPQAATGSPTGSAAASAGVVVPNQPPTGRKTLIEENFGGNGTGLHGTVADTFDAAITSAGGSATWVAATTFLQDGTVTAADGNSGAYLNLGTYIDNAKGTADGKFQLTMSISETTGAWISLGFTTQNAPGIAKNFTNTGTGGNTYGVATIIRRSTTSSPANEIDAFRLNDAGTGQTALDGPDGLLGTRTLTIELDFTPAGGYNGTTDFGTARFFDIGYDPTTPFQTYTYTANRSFGAIFISEADQTSGAESGGTISSLTLTQLAPAAPTFESWIGAFGLDPADRDFNDDPDRDGLPNGIEHVLGTNPGSPSSGIAAVSGTLSSLTFRHPLNPNLAADVSFAHQWSTDLAEWRASGQINSGGTRATVTSSPPDANAMVTVVLTVTEGPTQALFGRLAAQTAP